MNATQFDHLNEINGLKPFEPEVVANQEIERRKMLAMIPEEYILEVIAGRMTIVGVPDGSRFVSANYDYQYRAFAICVEHESFRPIWSGCELPILPVEFHIRKAEG